MTTITLPWPNRDLHPNSRVHWGRRARAAKKARHDAQWAAQAAGVRHIDAKGLEVTVTFHPPSNHRRDVDGLLSNVKSYLDGIADVCGVDDSKWSIKPLRGAVVKNGEVRVLIQPIEEEAAA